MYIQNIPFVFQMKGIIYGFRVNKASGRYSHGKQVSQVLHIGQTGFHESKQILEIHAVFTLFFLLLLNSNISSSLHCCLSTYLHNQRWRPKFTGQPRVHQQCSRPDGIPPGQEHLPTTKCGSYHPWTTNSGEVQGNRSNLFQKTGQTCFLTHSVSIYLASAALRCLSEFRVNTTRAEAALVVEGRRTPTKSANQCVQHCQG